MSSAEKLGPNYKLRRLLLAGLIAVSASCAHEFSTASEVEAARDATRDKQANILEQRGLTGRLQLSYIKAGSEVRSESQSSGSLEGDLTGLYFLVAGGVDGEIEADSNSSSVTEKEQFIMLACTTNSEIPITTPQRFPLDLIQVVESPGLTAPEVEFGINQAELVYLGDRGNQACWYDDYPGQGKEPGYQPERCMTTTDSENLKDIVKPEVLKYVRLYLAPELAAEFYAQVGNS